MKLLDRILCKYLLRRKRFTEALALDAKTNSLVEAERTWALYNLGCYRSISSNHKIPNSGREAVAYGIAKAATGQISRGAELLRSASDNGLLNHHNLSRAARDIAPYSPTTALYLSRRQNFVDPGFEAAILLSLGRANEALDIIEQALRYGHDRKYPDLLLLHANAKGQADLTLRSANAYLARHGLSALAQKDSQRPLSTTNLVSRPQQATVRGPLVTITMPAYNSSERIGSAIESLLAQTYRDIEVLVVDDGSNDDTVIVVKQLALKDSRVRLLERSQNGGPYAARNMALAYALGEFVTCHDSDDWAHPEKIAIQVAPLLNDARLAFTLSSWVRVQDDGHFYARQIYPLTRLNPASPLFRRTPTLERAGFYDNVRTGADSEYTARLELVFGPRGWKRLNQPLVFGAHRPGSLMTDSTTGNARGSGINAQRLDYWEVWSKRHIDTLHQGASLYRGFDGI